MKTIELINHNNKLNNDVFIHIAAAPAKPIMESALPFKYLVAEKQLSDQADSMAMLEGAPKPAKPFEVEMFDLVRCRLTDLNSMSTFQSHGVDRATFLQANKHLGNIAIYLYRRVEN